MFQRWGRIKGKASYTEDLLDQLNLTVYRQQQQIDQLMAEVVQLRQQVPDGAAESAARGVNLRDELPPHY